MGGKGGRSRRNEKEKVGERKKGKKKRKEERGKWGTLSSTVSPEDAREGRAYIHTCQRLPARVPPCLCVLSDAGDPS